MSSSDNAKVKKSSIPAIRESMLQRGALLFGFKPKDVSTSKQEQTWFNQMQELGFLVTTTGCIFPYENFSSASKGRPKGHKVSALFFKGSPPTSPENSHGWPSSMQVSHLCHRKKCINPNHIVYEPQWMNLKRNYCGINGKCDCGLSPKCLATYHNDDWSYNDEFISYNTPDFKKLLKPILSGYKYVVFPKDKYESIDNRRRQRNERLAKKKEAKLLGMKRKRDSKAEKPRKKRRCTE